MFLCSTRFEPARAGISAIARLPEAVKEISSYPKCHHHLANFSVAAKMASQISRTAPNPPRVEVRK